LQRGDQSIEDGFQILWALTEQAFHTVPMYGEFANLPGDVSIDINPHRPGLTSRCGFVIRGNPGKRVVKTSSGHPVHDKFLNVSSATGAPDSILPRQLRIPLQDFQLILPSIFRQQEPQAASRFFISTNRAKVFSYVPHVMPPFIRATVQATGQFVPLLFEVL
jgi:hypothetical protein